MNASTDGTADADREPKRPMLFRRRPGLFGTFLLVLVPFLAFLAVGGFGVINIYETRDARDDLALRLGDQAGRLAGALSRNDVLKTPSLVRDFLAPFTTDHAVTCIDVVGARDGASIAGGPGCAKAEAEHQLAMPVGIGGEALLLVSFTADEVVERHREGSALIFSTMLVTLVAALIAAAIAFRLSVGRPLAALGAAIRRVSETGDRLPVGGSAAGELGEIMRAFDSMLAREAQRETELARTAESVQELNKTLEARVERRTQRLRESEGQLRQLVEGYPSALYIQIAGRIVFANEAAAKQTGASSPDGLVGRDSITLFHPSFHDYIKRNRPRVLEQNARFASRHLVCLRLDGTEYPVRTAVRSIVWDNRRAILVEFVDITAERGAEQALEHAKKSAELAKQQIETALEEAESANKALQEEMSQRARAEAALKASESRLRGIYEAAGVGIGLADRSGRICQHNPAFAAMLGYDGEELIGKTFLEITHPADVALNADKFECLKAGEIDRYQFEKRYIRKDGTTCWADLQSSALHARDGSFEYVMSVVRDITEQKEAAEKLKIATAEAEQASQAKSEFLAMMSHELRTPMHGILGMTGLILGSELTESQRTYAERIKASGDTLLSLLNGILDLSKIEAGGLEIEDVAFRFDRVLSSVTALTESRARTKGLAFETIISPEVPEVLRGDPGWLQQVLLNLVGNAIKFTETGAITISVAATPVDDHSHDIRFEVRDTGDGIDEAVRERVFDRFAQADGSITRKHGGTGLGLAISKELVQLMGGSIGVEPNPGGGSIFWFNVVCGRAGVEDLDETEKDVGPVPKVAPRTGPGLRILVAEDNLVNQMIAVETLEGWGHRADVVSNGREAVEAVDAASYDLILMDIFMPEVDGLTATKQIRAKPGSVSSIPIIALTADAMAGERERYLAAGMDDYVSKPFEPNQLFGTIERCYANAQRRAAAS